MRDAFFIRSESGRTIFDYQILTPHLVRRGLTFERLTFFERVENARTSRYDRLGSRWITEVKIEINQVS